MSHKDSDTIKLTDDIILIKYRKQSKIERGIASPTTVIITKNSEILIIDPSSWTYNLKKFLHYTKNNDILGKSTVRKIALTHEHWDHILSSSFYQEKYNFELSCDEKEKKAVEDEDLLFQKMFEDYTFLADEMKLVNVSKAVVKRSITWMWGPYRPMKVTNTLKENDVIFNEPKTIVIETPSHTSGSLSYYLPTEKILVIGDLLDLENGVGLDLNNPYSSVENGLNSLKKVKNLDVETIIPGHGDIVVGRENIQNLIESRIEETNSIYSRIIEKLESSSLTLGKLTIQLFPETRWKINLFYLRKYMVYAYLNELNKKRGLNIEKRLGRTLLSL